MNLPKPRLSEYLINKGLLIFLYIKVTFVLKQALLLYYWHSIFNWNRFLLDNSCKFFLSGQKPDDRVVRDNLFKRKLKVIWESFFLLLQI